MSESWPRLEDPAAEAVRQEYLRTAAAVGEGLCPAHGCPLRAVPASIRGRIDALCELCQKVWFLDTRGDIPQAGWQDPEFFEPGWRGR